ncbi:hypothetical protein VTJ49DRAFT_2190 [Mycothermus thermophilus]|uniref:Uncharacterized protein n=1 Tax=Humicola insolens TaxID=85995 RepID=A0ABR3VCC6_HUMIN
MPPRKNPKQGTPEKPSDAKAYVDAIFTPREQVVLIHCLLTIKGFGQDLATSIDLQKVAERLELQNHRSVSNAWCAIKKKFAEHEAKVRAESGETGEPATATTNNGENKAEKQEVDDNPSPTKRPRTMRKASTATNGDPATPKKPRAPRGKKAAAAQASVPTTPATPAGGDQVNDQATETSADDADDVKKEIKQEPDVQTEGEAGEVTNGADAGDV